MPARAWATLRRRQVARLTPKAAPSASQSQRAKVAELVDDAIERGAQATTGARAWGGEGCFYQPTVLSGVSDDARILREEVCGPVAPITTFADEDEALAEALATSTAWSPTCSPVISTVPFAWASRYERGWSASTRSAW